MPIRPFALPQDFATLLDLLPRAFVYPDNEAWNIQQDELETLMDAMQSARRLWPLLRALQVLSPTMRDVMRGFVWEEDGRPVGVVNVLRMGSSDQWLIGNVAVLPDYRRRGIARALVQAAIEYARARRAERLILEVVAGNTPAYNLYLGLGFEHFSDNLVLRHQGEDLPERQPLPPGYISERLPRAAWQERYELARRVTPATIQKFVPVVASRFRAPVVMRAVEPVFMRLAGQHVDAFRIRHVPSGLVVGVGRVTSRTRPGGLNFVMGLLDPAHAALAPFMVHSMLQTAVSRSPGRRIEWEILGWEQPLLDAALRLGFVQAVDYHTLGLPPGDLTCQERRNAAQ